LLDVSVLIASGVRTHSLHGRVVRWLKAGQFSELLTCSITELGFIRIVAQTPQYQTTIERAQITLAEMKRLTGLPFVFLEDDQDASRLPAWVRTGGQTTDGHLMQLAEAHGAILATLDLGIPGAFVIP
jgi:predicted nucleic acid-binding protein